MSVCMAAVAAGHQELKGELNGPTLNSVSENSATGNTYYVCVPGIRYDESAAAAADSLVDNISGCTQAAEVVQCHIGGEATSCMQVMC